MSDLSNQTLGLAESCLTQSSTQPNSFVSLFLDLHYVQWYESLHLRQSVILPSFSSHLLHLKSPFLDASPQADGLAESSFGQSFTQPLFVVSKNEVLH